MWNRHAIVAGVVALGLAVAGCSKLEPSASGAAAGASVTVKQGGKLTMAASADITDWNPLSAAGDTTGARQIQWPLYPHTFVTRADGTTVVNDALLESAKVVGESPMKVEYRIKPGAVWSDGTPITVADFKFTQAVQDPKQCPACKRAFSEGYSAMTAIDGSDEGRTVTITYAKPFAQWQALFNYILPAHVGESMGAKEDAFNSAMAKNPPKVSGGPYLVSDWQKGVSITLTKNPKWYGKPANLDSVVIRIIAGQGEQLTALQNGEIDLVYQIPTLDTANQAKQLSNTVRTIGPIFTYYHLGMKTTGDLMDDATFRKGVAQAINLGDIRERTVAQFAPEIPLLQSAAYMPGQKFQGIDAYQPTVAKVGVGQGDVQKALATLKSGGYELVDGKLVRNGKPVRDLKLVTLATDQLRMQMAQVVQAQLRQIGLTVTIDAADGARYAPSLFKGAFDIMATGTATDLGSMSLAQWYASNGGRSFGYRSEIADDLFRRAEGELDPAKQVELMHQIDETLIGDSVVLPLYSTPQMAVHRNNFANIFVNPSKYGTTMNIEEWGMRS